MEPETVIVVCYGNICRSPMGEVLLRRELDDRGLAERIRVESAGYLGDGHGAHAYAILTMEQRGLDLSDHSSSLLTPMRIHGARWILAMEEMLLELTER